MRWKVLVLAPLIAAIVSVGVWSALAIAVFGSALELERHRLLFFASILIPLICVALAGIFTYRHTARRRKTQALLTVILAAIVALAGYSLVATFFPGYFSVARMQKLK